MPGCTLPTMLKFPGTADVPKVQVAASAGKSAAEVTTTRVSPLLGPEAGERLFCESFAAGALTTHDAPALASKVNAAATARRAHASLHRVAAQCGTVRQGAASLANKEVVRRTLPGEAGKLRAQKRRAHIGLPWDVGLQL